MQKQAVKKIIVIAGGEPPSKELLLKELAKNSILIAVDSGANCLWKYKITPDYLIGDFDSIKPAVLSSLVRKNVDIKSYPSNKDFTDAELALKKAALLRPCQVVFLGCLGGKRVDHLLGALNLLATCFKLKIDALLKDDFQTVQLITKSCTMRGKNGKYFSLLAYGKKVAGLSISGAKYNLSNYSLNIGNSLTISNEFKGSEVRIKLSSGNLLLIREV